MPANLRLLKGAEGCDSGQNGGLRGIGRRSVRSRQFCRDLPAVFLGG